MKLREYLLKVNGRHIHIGSGTAYFYMDIVDESTLGTINRISDEYCQDLLRKKMSRQARLERMPDLIKTAEYRLKDLPALIKQQKKTVKAASKRVDQYADAVNKELKGAVEKAYKEECRRLNYLTDEKRKMPERIEALKKEQKRLPDLIEKLNEKYENFVPFADREVKKTYPSLLNNAVCCIIEGNENGKYWFEQEYKNPELLKAYEEESNEQSV